MAKDYAKSFYNSGVWRKTQAAYLSSRNYICEDCGGVACVVHHIRHITPGNIHDPGVTLDWSNLKALCAECHAIEHQGKVARLNGVAFDAQGNIMKQPDVFLVCGSGKRAYIAAHKGSHDLVVDDDLLLAALSGETGVCKAQTGHLDAVLGEIKPFLHSLIKTRFGQWQHAYISCTASSDAERQALAQEINAEIISTGE